MRSCGLRHLVGFEVESSLVNLSRDSEQDYFVDGMTDALRERLEGIGLASA